MIRREFHQSSGLAGLESAEPVPARGEPPRGEPFGSPLSVEPTIVAPPPATPPDLQAAYLLSYLAERVSLAEGAVHKGLAQSAATQEVLDLFSAPSVYGSFGPARGQGGAPNLGQQLVGLRVERIGRSGLFDDVHYASQFPDGLPPDLDPIEHYVRYGWVMAKDPSPLFSTRYYLGRYPDVRGAGIDPLTHYIERGSSEMRDPHPLFRNYYYASQNAASLPEGLSWLAYFLSQRTQRTSPHPIFDVDDYATRTRTDPQSAAEALLHYVSTGWRDGIDVSPLFRTDHYQRQVGGQAICEPYTHYSMFGVPHALDPHPLFDVKRYRSTVKDMDSGLDPLIHYIWKGEAASVSPHALFDTSFYQQRYHHEIGRRGALWHYLTEGAGHDYLPNAHFDPAGYRKRFMSPDPEANRDPPLEHFARVGVLSANGFNVEKLLASVALAEATAPLGSAVAILSLPLEEVAKSGTREFPGKLPHVDGRPNVLLVAHSASAHLFGSERSLLDMLEGLAGIGANAFVVLPANAPDYTHMIRRRCERVFICQYGWWRKGDAPSASAREVFRNIIRANAIQVVHANTIMLRECIEAARDEQVSSVVHIRELITHDEDLVRIIGRSVPEIIAEVRSRTDWIIGNSGATAKAFYKPDVTSIVPNTIDVADMDMVNTVDPACVRFGLISSNLPKKGVFDLVQVARLCRETAPNAEFLLIGPDSPAILELKEMARSGHIPPSIKFPGYAASPKDAIHPIDVVLNLSHFAESFGRTVLEAMAARRPAIVYAWGALPELIEHGQTGFLCPHLDVLSVARHVAELCEFPARIAEMGNKARAAAVAKYSLHSYRKLFRETYSRILPGATFAPDAGRAEPEVRPARLPGLKERRADNRIAYVCWHFPVPSETFVLNELRVLVERGADVLVFCRHSPHRGFTPDFPIEYERVDSTTTLARRLKETARTIVHAHFVYPTVTNMVWPACEIAEIPFTFMAHAQDIFVHSNNERSRLAEIGGSKWCLRAFTLSRFHQDFIQRRGFPPGKIVINPNAVDTGRFLRAGPSERERRASKRIVAIHRFVEKKGLSLLIQAAPLIQDLGIHIEIYGYGELEADYRRLVETLGVSNVTINGALTQTEVAETIAGADLFACPAIRTEDGNMDGIPTSIVESMVAGIPVLATALGGIAELVEDGITGIICEPTPQGVADAIRRFYGLPDLQVRAIVEEARSRAIAQHDAGKLVSTLSRVWDSNTVDIVIVAWNNLVELRMVVDAVLANTALPYHLIICDNLSEREDVFGYLEALWAADDRVTIVHNSRNAMVGPATNLAMAQGCSDIVIYACGKECVSFRNSWENALVTAFTSPDIGLVGSLGHSPSYPTGELYPKGIRLFDKFRNKAFATDNPERPFRHVQGGLFAMSRRMVEQIGGFSDDVPHDYTDVEYSFYAESCGWKLAEAEGMLALFNKSRPTLSQRFRDDIKVAHPVLPHQIASFQGVLDGRLRHCNICDWYGKGFTGAQCGCPECGSMPLDRSLFRWLSDSTLLHRRLLALSVGLVGKMAAVWAEHFQGPTRSMTDFRAELRRAGRLPNASRRLHVAAIRLSEIEAEDMPLIAAELGRLMATEAVLLVQLNLDDLDQWDRASADLSACLLQVGFSSSHPTRYASRALGYSFLPLHVFRKDVLE